MTTKLYELSGWVGVACIVVAYACTTFGVIRPNEPIFFTLNSVGAVGIIIDSSHQHDWQPVVLNIFWLVIAIIGLARYLLT